MTRDRSVLYAGAILALAASVALWPVVAGARSFFHLDLRYEHVPIWHATQRALLSGASPFWIDGQYCGNPLLFHQEAPLFYPLTAPLLATGAPAHRLADLFTLFHVWLAGFAAFLLLRDLGCDPSSALFGGVGWMLSARVIQSAIWPNAVAVLALLPLLLLGIARISRGRRRSGLLWASVSGGLALLAARPHVLVGAAPLVAAVTAWAIVRSPRRWRAISDLALAALLAAALAAPSLLPSALLFPETSRARGLTAEERNLQPVTRGDVDQVFLPVDGRGRWPEAAAYAGLLAAFLFAVGIIRAFRKDDAFPRLLFAAIAIGGTIGLVFAFGDDGPLRLVSGLPPFRGFRVPARYLVSWSLALAIGSALVLSGVRRGVRTPAAIAALCVGGLSADLILHARGAAPTAPSEVYSSTPALVSALRGILPPDETGFPRRLWSLAPPLFLWTYDDVEMLPIAQRFEGLYGAIGITFGLETIGGAGPSLSRWKQMFQRPLPRNAALGGVGALVSVQPPASPTASPPGGPQPLVVRPFSGLPRAIVVAEAVVVPASQSIAATLDESLDPRRTAVLEDGPPLAADRRWDLRKGSVRLLRRAPGRLSLATTLPGDGVLVVFNTFENGWRAKVDGVPARVSPADGAFQGVRLSAGDHVVELRYRPRGVATGIAIGALGVLGLILTATRTRTRTRTRDGAPA